MCKHTNMTSALSIFWICSCLLTLQAVSAVGYTTDPAVQLFQEYLQINTTRNNDLTPAVQFWQRLAAAENLPFSVYEFTQGCPPVVVIKWPGTNSSASSIMLNSHMDVVPAAEEDGWTYPPFSAHIDENGNIYARGSQDMKCVSIQYFEALRKFKANNVTFLRDVYMTLMPDEELGGGNGMVPFLKSKEFIALNVGVAMDEGISNPLDVIALFYQDKVAWSIQVDCYGVGGHGSSFPATNSTATGKCINVINRIFEFRDAQYEEFEPTIYNAKDYTSVNLNKINAGIANNILPQHMSMVFDIRLATSLNEDNFEAQLERWVEEAGTNITLTYIIKNHQMPATRIDETNPYWVAITNAVQKLNICVMPRVSAGSSDARYVRNIGIPAFGFSPMPNTPQHVHAVDEYLNVDIFRHGIKIYEEIIYNMANIPADQTISDPFTYMDRTAS